MDKIKAALGVFSIAFVMVLTWSWFLQPSKLLEYLQATSGPFAVIAAVAASYISLQIANQAETGAAKRQADEFKRAEEKAQKFAKTSTQLIMQELDIVVKMCDIEFKKKRMDKAINKKTVSTPFIPHRPFYEGIKNQIAELPNQIVVAISMNEGRYQAAVDDLINNTTATNARTKKRDEKIGMLRMAAIMYLADLSGRPLEDFIGKPVSSMKLPPE